MKICLGIAVILAAVLFGTLSSSAQTRVKFRHGHTSAILTGKLTSFHQKRVFLVHVRSGQTMAIRDIGHNAVSIFVDGPAGSGYEQDLAADCHGRTDISPTSAGDYKLTVQECQKVDRWRGTFRARVNVH
jgi:hypothetical protein